MKKVFKWGLVIGGVLAVLFAVVVVVVVMALDVDKLKPRIEKEVSAATGRTFTMGEKLDLSFFPWVGVALSDVKLGNPKGFSEPDFVSIQDFEVRLKLLPLLRKEIQVKRFVVRKPKIVLEKNAEGKTSWDFKMPGGKTAVEKTDAPQEKVPSETALPLAMFEVQEFSITGGTAVWIDQKTKQRIDVSDLTLNLTDLSLDQPVGVDFSAKVDTHPIDLQGKIGPVGREIGKNPVDLDITLKLLEDLVVKLSGRAENLLAGPTANLDLDIPAFSPRQVAERLKPGLIPPTADSRTLSRFSLKGKIRAGADRFSLTEGVMELDESRIDLSLDAKAFSRPDVRVDMAVDAIDVDRYVPPKASEKKSTGGKTGAPSEGDSPAPPDYTPLRKLVLDAAVKVGKLKVNRVRMENIDLKIVGRDGVFRLDPFDLGLYGGDFQAKGIVDVRQREPRSDLTLNLANVSAGPLVQDLSDKAIIEGLLTADLKIETLGDTPEAVKRSLSGAGALVFADGALVGVDLAGMARNIKTAFTGEAKPTERPKTDFTELALPFTIQKGVFSTADARLQSPLLRLGAKGTANMVNEKLDFRINPRLVATLTGQGDAEERKGINVPVLVGGTFAKPTFRPDLESLARQQIEEKLLESDKLKEVFEKNENLKPLEETTKGLIRGLFGPKDKK